MKRENEERGEGPRQRLDRDRGCFHPEHTLIDVGANLCHPCFDADLDEVVDYARKEAGVRHAVLTTTSLKPGKSATRNFAMCDRYGFVCTLGIHPHQADREFSDGVQFRHDALELLETGGERVVAIGETGLDYVRMKSSAAKQKACFEAHVALACELGLPLFLHQRGAHADFVQVLDRFRDPITARLPVDAVVHCFTGSATEAREYVDRGFYIGVAGFVGMRKRGRALRETVLEAGIVPLDRLMVESDCPYMIPDQVAAVDRLVDVGRNEPVTIMDTAIIIAGCLPGKPSFSIVAEATTRNAYDVFSVRNMKTVLDGVRQRS